GAGTGRHRTGRDRQGSARTGPARTSRDRTGRVRCCCRRTVADAAGGGPQRRQRSGSGLHPPADRGDRHRSHRGPPRCARRTGTRPGPDRRAVHHGNTGGRGGGELPPGADRGAHRGVRPPLPRREAAGAVHRHGLGPVAGPGRPGGHRDRQRPALRDRPAARALDRGRGGRHHGPADRYRRGRRADDGGRAGPGAGGRVGGGDPPADGGGRDGDRHRLDAGRSGGHRRHGHRARFAGARAVARRRTGLHRRLGHRSPDDHRRTLPVRAEHDAARCRAAGGSSAPSLCPGGAASAPTRIWTGCWRPSSPRRRPSPWCWRTRRPTGSSSRCTRTATGSPVTCTIWWSSGSSPPR
ncbi:LOW QUALITY PROTEIN: two-component sensor histidine kinase, partial [Streptomyces filamentosus NRRL 15998]